MDKKNLIIKLFKSLRGEKDFVINDAYSTDTGTSQNAVVI